MVLSPFGSSARFLSLFALATLLPFSGPASDAAPPQINNLSQHPSHTTSVDPFVYVLTNDGTCIVGEIPPPCAGFIEAIRTDTNQVVASISPSFGGTIFGADLTAAAASKDGTRLFVTASDTNQVGVIDTTTNTVISVAVNSGIGSNAIAVDDPTILVANAGSSNVTIFFINPLKAGALSPFGTTSLPAAPMGIAVKHEMSKGSIDKAYVTLANNTLAVFDTEGPGIFSPSTFPLGSTPGPLGIAITKSRAPSSTGTLLAYVAKSGGAVDVLDITTDSPTLVTTIPLAGAPGPVALNQPNGGTRVYVGLAGLGLGFSGSTNQFAVIDNTVMPPVEIAGSPFNLPDPTMPADGCVLPTSVAAAPLNVLHTTTVKTMYFPASAGLGCGSLLYVIDDGPNPSKDPASPLFIGVVDFFTTGAAGVAVPQ